MTSHRTVASVCCLSILVAMNGCGSEPTEDQLPTFPVEGTVNAPDGLDLLGLGVRFVPDPLDADRPEPIGAIQEDGSFTLTTYSPGDGAPAGGYRVLIIEYSDSGDEEDPADSLQPYDTGLFNQLPEVYVDFFQSRWKAQVTESGPNRFEFNLDLKRPRSSQRRR